MFFQDFNSTNPLFTKEKCCVNSNSTAGVSNKGCADASWKTLNDGVVNLIVRF
jgi:hypothetical protein